MIEREAALVELWKRFGQVTGVKTTQRNPATSPELHDLPLIRFFEMDDVVMELGGRGGYPIYKRRLTLIVESFIRASSEGAATKELGVFIGSLKRQVYAGGTNLGGTCSEFVEASMGRILRPEIGQNSIGLGLVFNMRYIEEVVNVFP